MLEDYNRFNNFLVEARTWTSSCVIVHPNGRIFSFPRDRIRYLPITENASPLYDSRCWFNNGLENKLLEERRNDYKYGLKGINKVIYLSETFTGNLLVNAKYTRGVVYKPQGSIPYQSYKDIIIHRKIKRK